MYVDTVNTNQFTACVLIKSIDLHETLNKWFELQENFHFDVVELQIYHVQINHTS